MSDLSNIVQVTISRETQSVARASFGTPAIISKFSTAKTTTVFVRHRYYASLDEMTADGWASTDFEYKAAQKIFSQNPKPTRVMIGRWDAGDANLTAALTAIQAATSDWYAFMIIATKTAEITWDADFVTGNSIDISINGTAVTTVPFNTDQATTMAAIDTQIEADIANSTVAVTGARTLTIDITDETPSSITVAVTGGASQATASIVTEDSANDQAYKDAAAWTETQKKLFFYSSSNSDILLAPTTDLISFMKSQNYDRTIGMYHPSSQEQIAPDFMEAGWMGKCLPSDAGSITWAFKTIAGVTAYELTSAQRTNVLAKYGNIYTTTAGVDITEDGRVASGEYIDIMRGLDWTESTIQSDIYEQLVNVDKVPFTDEGITLIAGTLQGALDKSANQGILVKDSIVVTAPKAVDVSSADKANRLLPDLNFTATLQGAIHKTNISGVVTV